MPTALLVTVTVIVLLALACGREDKEIGDARPDSARAHIDIPEL